MSDFSSSCPSLKKKEENHKEALPSYAFLLLQHVTFQAIHRNHEVNHLINQLQCLIVGKTLRVQFWHMCALTGWEKHLK